MNMWSAYERIIYIVGSILIAAIFWAAMNALVATLPLAATWIIGTQLKEWGWKEMLEAITRPEVLLTASILYATQVFFAARRVYKRLLTP